jgi:hypothetical protein
MNYEILLENRSGQNFSNIKIEYCIYHQCTIDETFMTMEYIEKKNANGYFPLETKKLPRRVVSNVTGGSWLIPEMNNRNKEELQTKEIRLRQGSEYKSDNYKLTRNTRKIDDELLGIRIRLYIPLKSGEKAMKEFFFPDTLEKTTRWVSPTD